MSSSRVRSSTDASRHPSRTMSQVSRSYIPEVPVLTQQHYRYVTSAPAQVSMMAPCLPISDNIFYPSNDGSYIPTSNVAPAALTFLDSMTPYDMDIYSKTSPSSTSTSSTSSSPPMSEAEMYQGEMYAVPDLGMEPFIYTDPWVTHMPLTPPEDPMFDMPELFCTSKADPNFPVTECEYLGVSKLQFSTRSG